MLRTTKAARPLNAARSIAFGSALALMLVGSLSLAADLAPIDKASEQVSAALAALKDVKSGKPGSDEHLEKARTLLARARAELLKAQGQDTKD